jgi:transcriptional regulator NrdR family protein
MEYIGKCPKCGKHNIIDSKRRIKPKSRPIQRFGRCSTCKKTTIENGREIKVPLVTKHTIIGEIVYLARLARRNAKAIRFWAQTQNQA